jgi:KTSC domain
MPRTYKLPTPALEQQIIADEDWEPTWVNPGSTRMQMFSYDERVRHLRVVFRDGTPWVYEDVPYGVYEAMLATPSAGRFVNQVLNHFPYRHASPSEQTAYFP